MLWQKTLGMGGEGQILLGKDLATGEKVTCHTSIYCA
jgi:hypothetical protein